jgi:hypothetical protein
LREVLGVTMIVPMRLLAAASHEQHRALQSFNS